MHYNNKDLAQFELLVEQGYLRKSVKGDLVLYGYTDKCTFARYWNEYTLAARGLILHSKTGEIIAKPFPKFFNLGEREETFLVNLPDSRYNVLEKVDGSLGIIYNYEGVWSVATRGSFYSDQAIEAQKILKDYDLTLVNPKTTLLVEIIYPENKIIVDYGSDRKLVLLGAYIIDTDLGSCREYDILAVSRLAILTGIEMVKTYKYTIKEMIELQKTLPKDAEGFVVRYANGFRVKIKGDEYMRIARILTHMSPLAFWGSMSGGIVNRDYLMQIPEEMREDWEPIVKELESQYKTVLLEIEHDFNKLPTHEQTPEARKQIGLFLKDNKLKHSNAMFLRLMGLQDKENHYIMKHIRPKANVLKGE